MILIFLIVNVYILEDNFGLYYSIEWFIFGVVVLI